MKTTRIAIFGASGRTGLQVVKQALDLGYSVTAIVRNPDAFPLRHERLDVRKGDVLNLSTFEDILMDHDAVISALGALSNKPTVLFSDGISNILAVMRKHHIHRVMAVSALAVEINSTMPLWMRIFIKNILQPLLRHIYADTLRMEQIIMKSDVEWTIVRPPQLTDKNASGIYRVAVGKNLANAKKISRADLAHYLLNNLSVHETFGKKVEVAY